MAHLFVSFVRFRYALLLRFNLFACFLFQLQPSQSSLPRTETFQPTEGFIHWIKQLRNLYKSFFFFPLGCSHKNFCIRHLNYKVDIPIGSGPSVNTTNIYFPIEIDLFFIENTQSISFGISKLLQSNASNFIHFVRINFCVLKYEIKINVRFSGFVLY